MAITKEEINTCLKRVIDPELGLNIVDIGLIYDVSISPSEHGQSICIVMTLTTPGCPLGQTISHMILDELASLPGVNPERDVVIELTFDPPWVIDMMSEEARAQLGM